MPNLCNSCSKNGVNEPKKLSKMKDTMKGHECEVCGIDIRTKVRNFKTGTKKITFKNKKKLGANTP